MSEFDEYIRQGEPGAKVKAQAWQTAIGLQDVDGLKPSAYLLDTAKRHIEGDITIEQVKGLIDTYYKSKEGRLLSAKERTEEADKVSARITELLEEDTLVTLSQMTCLLPTHGFSAMLWLERTIKTGRKVLLQILYTLYNS